MKRGSYIALALAVVGLATPAAASGKGAHGLILPGGAVEVGENRFRAPESYEDTLKFFDKAYHGIPRRGIVNQPGIRAMHFESSNPESGFEGFNVYEKDKEVRIFILPREEAGSSSKPTSKKHR